MEIVDNCTPVVCRSHATFQQPYYAPVTNTQLQIYVWVQRLAPDIPLASKHNHYELLDYGEGDIRAPSIELELYVDQVLDEERVGDSSDAVETILRAVATGLDINMVKDKRKKTDPSPTWYQGPPAPKLEAEVANLQVGEKYRIIAQISYDLRMTQALVTGIAIEESIKET